jgi:hypothetical protein
MTTGDINKQKAITQYEIKIKNGKTHKQHDLQFLLVASHDIKPAQIGAHIIAKTAPKTKTKGGAKIKKI